MIKDRAEHWIVVAGTACVTRGAEELLLAENQSTYIPLGTVHRLENPGKVPLEIIEVQSGAYLGEDDIVRFQDSCGRDIQSEKFASGTAPAGSRDPAASLRSAPARPGRGSRQTRVQDGTPDHLVA